MSIWITRKVLQAIEDIILHNRRIQAFINHGSVDTSQPSSLPCSLVACFLWRGTGATCSSATADSRHSSVGDNDWMSVSHDQRLGSVDSHACL